jgi:hypothetical protein
MGGYGSGERSTLKFHNHMGHIQWYTVVDNVSNQTILDANFDVDEVRQAAVAADANGHGNVTYTPKGYIATHRDQFKIILALRGDDCEFTEKERSSNGA